MKTVAIIDYGMGNLDSVKRAVEECGGFPIVTNKESDIQNATHIILPGVGAFPLAMQALRKKKLDQVLSKQVLQNKIPFLGLCLGMQLLAKKSFEIKETEGLGWIDGEVIKFIPDNKYERIPHIGWNEVEFIKKSPILDNIQSGKDFYFVHSYHLICRNKKDILALTPYCGKFVSVIGKDNIFAAQFHPEKSQKVGFQFLKNFLQL